MSMLVFSTDIHSHCPKYLYNTLFYNIKIVNIDNSLIIELPDLVCLYNKAITKLNIYLHTMYCTATSIVFNYSSLYVCIFFYVPTVYC